MIREETLVVYEGYGVKGALFLNTSNVICCITHPEEDNTEPIIKSYSFPGWSVDSVEITPLPGKENEVRKWVAMCNLLGCVDEIKILPSEGEGNA